MGYWSTNEDGVSFDEAESGEDMVWGDQPADIIDDALGQVALTFLHDVGRLPTRKEVLAGLYFSMGGKDQSLLDLPETVAEAEENAKRLTDEQETLLAQNYYGTMPAFTQKRNDAWKVVRPILDEQRKPYADANSARQKAAWQQQAVQSATEAPGAASGD